MIYSTKNHFLESFNELHRAAAVLQVENCSSNKSGPLEDRAFFWAKEHGWFLMNMATILMRMFLTVYALSSETNEYMSGYTQGSLTFCVSPLFPAWVHPQMY